MKKILLRTIAVFLCVVFVIGTWFIVNSVQIFKKDTSNGPKSETFVSEVSGTTYYVDAASSEGNDGKTPKTALKTLEEVNRLSLKPGDQVLFKKDCLWNGGLILSASGSKEEPICYGSYGSGDNMPVINGNGAAYAAVYGVDVSYIHISDLEITNVSDETSYLRGIFINALHKDVEGIKITRNYVHNVDSSNKTPTDMGIYNVGLAWSDFHWIGGIIVRAGGYAVHEASESEQVILNDILVEENTVDKVSVDGITVGSVSKSWRKSTGVVVRNNTVNRCAGDGILVFACKGSLIEGNRCDANGQAGPLRTDMNFVGIFIIYCNDTVIQYNEVSNQCSCTDDGQGYDVDDTCVNTLVQYNYSHDNYNGFLLLFNMNNNGHVVVRYNISQNDGGPFVTVACKDSVFPMVMTADVYNNTCFTNKQLTEMIELAPNLEMRKAENKRVVLNVYNNIFVNKGNGNLPVLNNETYYDYMNFSNNCWYGFSKRTLPQNEENQQYCDPLFCFAGSDNISGYQLLKDSTCIGAGRKIFNDGGMDYFGNIIGESLNIGAYYGAGVSKLKNSNLALNGKVTMSSTAAIAMLRESTLAKVADGDKTKVVTTKPADSDDSEEWFEVDLEDTYDISKVVLYAGTDSSLFPKSFTVDIWNGTEWKTVSKQKNYKTPKDNTAQTFKFKKCKGSKVRIHITAMNENENGKFIAGLSEIEVY